MITADDIAHSPSGNLPDILAQVPGVQLTSLYGIPANGAKTSVDLRGFGAFATANTLILVNGRRLNDIDMAQVDLSTIPLNSIERIEITRGNSGAVLYGDNAVGGVVIAGHRLRAREHPDRQRLMVERLLVERADRIAVARDPDGTRRGEVHSGSRRQRGAHVAGRRSTGDDVDREVAVHVTDESDHVLDRDLERADRLAVAATDHRL